MREVFQQELREVQDRLVEISTLVASSIERATESFNESNVTLAETVIADDQKIDALAAELDELAIQILARQNPVARDLRIVVSALRISDQRHPANGRNAHRRYHQGGAKIDALCNPRDQNMIGLGVGSSSQRSGGFTLCVKRSELSQYFFSTEVISAMANLKHLQGALVVPARARCIAGSVSNITKIAQCARGIGMFGTK